MIHLRARSCSHYYLDGVSSLAPERLSTAIHTLPKVPPSQQSRVWMIAATGVNDAWRNDCCTCRVRGYFLFDMPTGRLPIPRHLAARPRSLGCRQHPQPPSDRLLGVFLCCKPVFSGAALIARAVIFSILTDPKKGNGPRPGTLAGQPNPRWILHYPHAPKISAPPEVGPRAGLNHRRFGVSGDGGNAGIKRTRNHNSGHANKSAKAPVPRFSGFRPRDKIFGS